MKHCSLLPACVCLATLAAAPQLHAEEPGWFARAQQEIVDTARRGTPEYYLPTFTWHLPFAYSRDQVDGYQNHPLGFGYGVGHFDDRGDWHGLYGMGFQDSHFKPEWIGGYAWKTYWQLPNDFKVGLGYTAGITTRTDYGHYAPIPILLPVGSVDYGKFSLEAAYVPGGKGFGNVVFVWAKWRMDRSSSASKVAP